MSGDLRLRLNEMYWIVSAAKVADGDEIDQIKERFDQLLPDVCDLLKEAADAVPEGEIELSFGRAEILHAAARCVLQDRNTTHGTPEDSFSAIARLWTARLGTRIQPHEVAIMMADVKTARAWANPTHVDNWVDLAGYAACGGELAGDAS